MQVRRDRRVPKAMPAPSVRPVLRRPPGPVGPQGQAGPPSPSIRVVRSDCVSGLHRAVQDDEVLVTAYCGPTRNQAQFLGERGASCGPAGSLANTPLVAVCVGPPK